MSRSKPEPVEAIPFTNDMEQTIQPGDTVLIITKSVYGVDLRKGTYLGSRKSPSWRNTDYVTVVCEAEKEVTEMRHKVTGERMKHRVPGLVSPVYPVYSRQHSQEMQEYESNRDVYLKALNQYRADFHQVKRIKKYRINLQRNRIFPLT